MKQHSKRSIPSFFLIGLLLASVLTLAQPMKTQAKSNASNTKKQQLTTAVPLKTAPSKEASDKTSSAKSMTLNMRSMKLVKGKTMRLKVLNLPSNHSVTYQSSNTKIATVSSNGTVKGIKNGQAVITATIKQKTKTVRKLTCQVVVGPAAVSIVIPKSSITLIVGKSSTISYITKPSNCVEIPVFKSSNKKVATITSTGVIKTHSAGTAKITATIANGKSAQLTVVVKKASSKK